MTRRSRDVRKIAELFADTTRSVGGLVRAQQVSRTVVPTTSGPKDLGDLLVESAETTETVANQQEAIGVLGDLASTSHDAWQGTEEALYDNADAAHEARMEAITAQIGVNTALDEAASAANDASNALSTANGKNARRRGVTEPDAPPGGWAQGDQWIRDVVKDGVPVPTEVLVWNGTEFVPESILTGEVLTIGPNGVVRLADGTVTANNLVADAIDGRVIQGTSILGGTFDLIGYGSITNLFNDPCESLSGWGPTSSGSSSAATLSTTIFHGGTRSIKSGTWFQALGDKQVLTRVPTTPILVPANGFLFECYVYVTERSEIQILFQESEGSIPNFRFSLTRTVDPGWTKVEGPISGMSRVGYFQIVSAGASAFYVDDVAINGYGSALDRVTISRDPLGSAYLSNGSVGTQRQARIQEGRFFAYGDSGADGPYTWMDPSSITSVAKTSSGGQASLTNLLVTAGTSARSDFFSPATSSVFSVRNLGIGVGHRLDLEAPTIRINGATRFDNLPTYTSDTGWVALNVTGWTHQTAPRVRVRNGRVWFRGLISNDTFNAGFTNCGTLPTGIPRPTYQYRTQNVGMSSTVAIFRVLVDGTMQMNRSGTTSAWCDLSSFSYEID